MDSSRDATKSLQDVLAGGMEEDEISPFSDVCEGFDQVIAEMRIREMPKRSVWSVPMNIADNFVIGVKGYEQFERHWDIRIMKFNSLQVRASNRTEETELPIDVHSRRNGCRSGSEDRLLR